MTKKSSGAAELRGLIGRPVRVQGRGYDMTGRLIGPSDGWRAACQEIAATVHPRHPKLWAAEGDADASVSVIYFVPGDATVTVSAI